MARTTLTPVSLTKATPLQVTANLTSISAFTGVQWVNSGREFLVIVLGATAASVTENIGITIQGQPVTAPAPALTVSATQILGPFPTQFNQTDGTNNIYLDFTSTVACSVMLCLMPGVA
jgi:hypothetical protein